MPMGLSGIIRFPSTNRSPLVLLGDNLMTSDIKIFIFTSLQYFKNLPVLVRFLAGEIISKNA
jgi:hypothetical protein